MGSGSGIPELTAVPYCAPNTQSRTCPATEGLCLSPAPKKHTHPRYVKGKLLRFIWERSPFFPPQPKVTPRAVRLFCSLTDLLRFVVGAAFSSGYVGKGITDELRLKTFRDGKVHSCPVQKLQCNFPLQLGTDGGSTAAVFDLIKEDVVSDVLPIKNTFCECFTA